MIVIVIESCIQSMLNITMYGKKEEEKNTICNYVTHFYRKYFSLDYFFYRLFRKTKTKKHGPYHLLKEIINTVHFNDDHCNFCHI